MIVLYNINKISNIKQVKPKDQIKEYDLSNINESDNIQSIIASNRSIKIARVLYTAETLEQDYMGAHTAPSKASEDDPIYNVTENIYPQDIYEGKGHYYTHMNTDKEGLNIILDVKNKPNAKIKVYRAVPDLNKDTNNQTKDIQNAIASLNAIKDHRAIKTTKEAQDIIYSLKDKYSIEKYDYDTQQDLMIEDLEKQRDELEKQVKKPLKIEKGNWITPSKQYAIQHGKSNLNNNYKILTKTVRAKDLYTNGDSLSEWGYDPA